MKTYLMLSLTRGATEVKIIIATGFYDFPYMLDVPGENLPKVLHYYKEAHPFLE